MIKRPTLVLLIILTLFLAAYFIINDRLSATATVSTPAAASDNYLITSVDGALQVLHIVDKQNHAFQMQRDSRGTWLVTLPSQGTADQGRAEAADTQVGALRILTTLDNQLNLLDAGLNSPAFTIELTFANSIRHVIQVGGLTPINNGYYVRFDEGTLYVVSQPGIDALVGLISSPPFPATMTPVPTIYLSITPTLEAITTAPTLELPTSTP